MDSPYRSACRPALSDPNTNAHPDADTWADANTRAHSDAYANTWTDADSRADTDADTDTNALAYPRQWQRQR